MLRCVLWVLRPSRRRQISFHTFISTHFPGASLRAISTPVQVVLLRQRLLLPEAVLQQRTFEHLRGEQQDVNKMFRSLTHSLTILCSDIIQVEQLSSLPLSFLCQLQLRKPATVARRLHRHALRGRSVRRVSRLDESDTRWQPEVRRAR